MGEVPPATFPVEVVEKRLLPAICKDLGGVVVVDSLGACVRDCTGACRGGRACVRVSVWASACECVGDCVEIYVRGKWWWS